MKENLELCYYCIYIESCGNLIYAKMERDVNSYNGRMDRKSIGVGGDSKVNCFN